MMRTRLIGRRLQVCSGAKAGIQLHIRGGGSRHSGHDLVDSLPSCVPPSVRESAVFSFLGLQPAFPRPVACLIVFGWFAHLFITFYIWRLL